MLSVFEQEEERLKRNEPHDFWFPPPETVLKLMETGKTKEALKRMLEFEKGGPVNGSGAYPLLAAGEFHEYIAKDLKKAINCYKEAVKSYPNEGLPSRASQAPFTVGVWANIKIAICLQKQGRNEQAVEYYEHHYPWRMFWFEIAECYSKAKNQAKALEAYKMAARYHLEDAWGSEPELAFRAAVVLKDISLMKKAVTAIKQKYIPLVAEATLKEIEKWAELAKNTNAIAIVKKQCK